ncbi:MAG: phosphatase PAP2 family protein [Ferruginibacter sp.]
MKKMNSFLLLISMIFYMSACKKNDGNTPGIADAYNNTMVLKWNDAAAIAVSHMAGIPPMTESRVYAMVNVAMHDALNNIAKKYHTYALTGATVQDASPDAAVAQAAHDVLVNLAPAQQAFADSILNISLGPIATGSLKDKGIELGKAAAAAMIAKRITDGASTAQYAIVQGTMPGQYQSTPPFAATGFASFPGWGKVVPFSLSTPSQFRPAAPYAINSPQYAKDLNEIKTMGVATGSTRTQDQTQLGVFWLENIPSSWSRIARILIDQKNLNGWNTARLLAILNMAEADANIAAFDGKYFYNFWRPITAVRLADQDGNDQTTGDGGWNLLGNVTPPVPDYPSNHAADGGAAAELLKLYFGTDNFSFALHSNTMPGTTRNFTSLSQAATEVSLSRIYVGYHFRNAVVAGEDLGRKIGRWVLENSLLAVRE